jgi:hypothetical protein
MRLVLTSLGRLVELCSVPLGIFVAFNEHRLDPWVFTLVLVLNIIAIVVSPLPLLLTATLSIAASFVALRLLPKLSDLASDHLLPRLVRWRWRIFTREMHYFVERRANSGSNFVLYLRPFDADFSTAAQLPYKNEESGEGLLGYTEDGSPLMNIGGDRPILLERFLRATLLPWGRMVALANPLEASTGASSYRFLAGGRDWREVVEHLCLSAKFIVCVVAPDSFVGDTPKATWLPAEARTPSFSRNALYASFYDEMLHLSKTGHLGKLLLVVRQWEMTDEKWRTLRTRMGQVGILLPDSPGLPDDSTRQSGLGLFVFNDSGDCRFHHWITRFVTYHEWNARVWYSGVQIFAALLKKKPPKVGLIIGLSEYRWLIGPSTRDVRSIVRKFADVSRARRHRETSKAILNALQPLRLVDRTTAIKELESLSREIVHSEGWNQKKTDVLLAVVQLQKTLNEDQESPTISALWDDAIAKTIAWHEGGVALLSRRLGRQGRG